SNPPGNDPYTSAYEVLFYRDRPDSGGAAQEGGVAVGKNAVITGLDMRDATASSSQYGRASYEIDFPLLPEGARRVGDATGKHIKDHLAIVLNNEVKSAPVINGQITDRGQISGSFTNKAAQESAPTLM